VSQISNRVTLYTGDPQFGSLVAQKFAEWGRGVSVQNDTHPRALRTLGLT